MLSPDVLDNWFTYHPPTPEQAPKYAAIREAEMAAHSAFAEIGNRKEGGHSPADCETVNAVTCAFVEVIDANAPDSADKTAAFRCVRLARNAMNEWIMAHVGAGFPLHIGSDGEARKNLVYARWQACGAIACGGK